jgi:hypothetical protein
LAAGPENVVTAVPVIPLPAVVIVGVPVREPVDDTETVSTPSVVVPVLPVTLNVTVPPGFGKFCPAVVIEAAVTAPDVKVIEKTAPDAYCDSGIPRPCESEVSCWPAVQADPAVSWVVPAVATSAP